MDRLALLLDLHRDGDRQGPGGDGETRLAIALSGLAGAKNLRIADIGCGTGASTLILAQDLDAAITAVDFLPDFLTVLERRADQSGLAGRIRPLEATMEDLPFEEATFDAIWSEGAIYNLGFAAGIKAWRRYLKPHGILAVSELTWLTAKRPEELTAHWDREYPGVATAAEKMALLEAQGYSPIGYFPLREHCWLDNYYRPLQRRFDAFLARQGDSEAAQAIVAAEQEEIRLYERFRAFVSYGFYVARRLPD